MGYTTNFSGKFELNKQLTLEDKMWLDEFTERDHRDEVEVPGFYCQWVPAEDGKYIQWDGNEKFYEYIEWIKWLIENFFQLRGYELNGRVIYQGEEIGDVGTITIKKNKVLTRKFK